MYLCPVGRETATGQSYTFSAPGGPITTIPVDTGHLCDGRLTIFFIDGHNEEFDVTYYHIGEGYTSILLKNGSSVYVYPSQCRYIRFVPDIINSKEDTTNGET